jgi:glutathione S-transferase
MLADAPAVRRLYDFHDSGNGYKVRLALAQLGIEHELVETDILTGRTRQPDFLAKNPNGRIPLLELADGTCLAESGAILFLLADGTPLLPGGAVERAQVLQWMFFEQYSHEPFVAVARFWCRHPEHSRFAPDELARKQAGGCAALDVMDRHLASHEFFAADRYTIADIALFAYTHVAEEGGIPLAGRPALDAWLARVRGEPGFVAMDEVAH